LVDLGPFWETSNGSMVVAVATGTDGPAGCLVGFHTQCSIDPPRYLVCLSRANHTYEVALGSAEITVNLLSADQQGLAELFGAETANDEADKFDRCNWSRLAGGATVLDGVAAWLVGSVVATTDLGDHVGFVLDPLELEVAPRSGGPLRYREIGGIQPGNPS
jgi:flavin reductase (DIM6/NTAB) family NADH-FMN oxidoreductase RutF